MALEKEQGVDLQKAGLILSPRLLEFFEARQDALDLLRRAKPKHGIPEFLQAIEAAKRAIREY